MQHAIKKIFRIVVPTLISAAFLSACGGSDTVVADTVVADTVVTSGTLSGTAAVGLPIVGGTVNVKCAGGNALNTMTSDAGTWQVTISGQTLPCAVQVSGGQVGGTAQSQPYHSIAVSFGTVNVTPLTDLVVANLTQNIPQTWFSAVSFTGINSQNISTTLSNVSTTLGLSSQLGTINPFTAAFQAQNGDAMDDILEAFRNAITAVSSNYATLLAASSSGNFSTFTGFGSAFTVAYGDLTGGANTGGGTGTGTGTADLTVETTVAGITSTITITGVPKPAGQDDFCGAIQTDTNLMALTASGGNLTINSCSFSGNVGNITATVSVTSPVIFSTTYTVKYTYN